MSWFRQKQSAVLGVDISTAAVKLLELRKVGARYRVESYAISALPKDAVIDKNIANLEVLADTIKAALKQSGSKLKQASVAVAGASVMTKVIPMSASLTDAEMEEQIIVEADRYVPYSLDEVYFDFEVQGENESNSEMVNVLLAASRKEIIDDRVKALAMAGLKVKIVDVEAFVMERAFSLLIDPLPDAGEDRTVAIVDIGSTLAYFAVLYNGRTVYSREQSFGGRQLTEEIQHRYGLTYAEAGLAKKMGGLPDTYAVDVLDPFKRAMVQQIQRSVQFFVSSTANRRIDDLILTGGCASIPGIDKWVQQALGIPTVIANPFINMSLSNKVEPQSLSKNASAMMVACGLALRSFD